MDSRWPVRMVGATPTAASGRAVVGMAVDLAANKAVASMGEVEEEAMPAAGASAAVAVAAAAAAAAAMAVVMAAEAGVASSNL
mmetsp:Transcript_36991/g.90222  ORF Transcript_36991/g.90222 Transcript_36991/m.90222 type:complete len:83 (+) Transcript_36991:592-840(+)